MSALPLRPIRRHIIHCSASTQGDVAEIRRWHLARGWNDIGYHFVIRPDGEVEVGRMLHEIGAHCDCRAEALARHAATPVSRDIGLRPSGVQPAQDLPEF
jgi:hypothetical protein